MKATGIVRRIDDLGRVVIPKEIRRTMHIKEGAPLEIFTDTQGGVIFKKYSPVGELTDTTDLYCEVLNRSVNMPVLICDRDHVISVSGAPKREFAERRISEALEDLMESRASFFSENGEQLLPVEGVSHRAEIAVPIISSGDILGAVVLLSSENVRATQTDLKLAQVAASFLGKQMED